MNVEPVAFYLPFRSDGVERCPDRSEDYWTWMVAHRGIGEGKYAWTLQTFLHLREAGFPCTITERFPDSGLVISHRDFLPVFLRPRPNVFLVCIKADRKEHTWANHYIVQNGRDSFLASRKGRNRTTVVPHWPQPSLMPRNAERGALVQNVAYFGRMLNLADELRAPEWATDLGRRGLTWAVVGQEKWNDYSAVDVTVSVRSFGAVASADPVMHPDSKPPTKLVNSWLAGVPAIVGRESAYETLRQSPLDCLEVGTLDELREALTELRMNEDLYRRMVAHGFERARGYSIAAICENWRHAFETDVARAFEQWRVSNTLHRSYANGRDLIDYFAKPQHWRDLLAVARKG